MPVTVTITTTKPDNVLFFHESSPENAIAYTELNAWVATLPGFMGVTLSLPDNNTRIIEYTFDTVKNYADAWAARSVRPEQVIKRAYKMDNDIQSTVNETLT
jgi:antibiotic biosynthesis monooxygenase (ABM) superfamily enzyme